MTEKQIEMLRFIIKQEIEAASAEMTQQHPIVPPPELVQQWWKAIPIQFEESDPNPIFLLATRAAQWGADQELEACCEWIHGETSDECFVGILRAARRPKSPSLKEQALEAMREMQIEPCIINGVDTNAAVRAKYETIRRALEQLPDNE